MPESQETRRQTPHTVADYARDVVFLDAVLLILTAVICYLIGWRTLYQYAEGLMWAGAIVIGVGATSPLGFWAQTRSLPYQYASTAIGEEVYSRIRRENKDAVRSYAYMFLLFFAGVFLIALSILIHQLI
jgi:hypothetical protein